MLCRRLAAIAGVALLAPLAHADVLIYSNDFESGVRTSEWSANSEIVEAPAFTKYVGRYALQDSVTLTLATPPQPHPISTGGSSGGGSTPPSTAYLLVFDLHLIDSWDGTDPLYGPDSFRVLINGVTHFDEVLGQALNQTYRAPDVGPGYLGYGPWQDSIYRDIAIPFDAGTAETLSFKFRGNTTRGVSDESWGVDNVRVYAVPTPGTLALVGAGAAMFMRRRRSV